MNSSGGKDHALLEPLWGLLLIGIDRPDEIEAPQTLFGQVSNHSFKHAKLSDIELAQLRNEIDVRAAANRMRHEMSAMEL